MTTEIRPNDPLVFGDWLDEQLGESHLRVYECTTYLDYLPPGREGPYRVRSARPEYDQEPIAGAAFLDIQGELSDPASPGHLRFAALAPDALTSAFARRGIGDSRRVVLYSRGRNVWTTHVWWMLRTIGFDAAMILDGGWEKWKREGRPTSSDEPVMQPVC